jgi:hypothetical protein
MKGSNKEEEKLEKFIYIYGRGRRAAMNRDNLM